MLVGLLLVVLIHNPALAAVNNNNNTINTIQAGTQLEDVEVGKGSFLGEEVELDFIVLQPGLQMSPGKVKGPTNKILNFTLISSNADKQTICWETSNNYLRVEEDGIEDDDDDDDVPDKVKDTASVEGGGQRDPFCVEVEEGEQMVFFSASLLGIFNVRFYRVAEGRKVYLEPETSPQLILNRDREAANGMVIIFFSLIMAVALALMGLDIELNIVYETFKRPIGPLVGMFSQFVVMPVFSYLIGWLLLETTYERLGLLLLGCSPGGAASNFWTAMYKGDVNLSCTMTFLSSCFSFAFTTLWVYVLGTPLVGKDIPIPYLRLVISLASFTLPLLIGVGFKHFWPKTGKVLKEKVSRPFFMLCLLVMPAIGIWNSIYFFYLAEWQHLISGCLLGVCGYTVGAGLAYIFRMGKPQIIAISLETAIQNGGIAFIILNLTFPSPYREMGIMPILGFFFLSTGPIMLVVFAVYSLVQCITKKKEFTQVGQVDAEEVVKRI